MKLLKMKKFRDQLLINVLASGEENAKAIYDAGEGYIVPGIAAADYSTIDEGVAKLRELKKAVPVVSIGLGGGGNFREWKRVVQMAVEAKSEHINQPYETASYAKGYLEANNVKPMINALVVPTGIIGKVRLSTGATVDVESCLDLAAALNIDSIKVMPVKGLTHLEELVFIAKEAVKRGIRGIEPAGGIKIEHVPIMFKAIQQTHIELFMPHIFGDLLVEPSKTNHEKVRDLLTLLKGGTL
ncbi:KDGP aldolase [Anoxybacteroides rupiense]|uniref:KDGP aldolase n=1 Tax=Anoxybacteroides rupiense TaxID=311460 RepID=UPI001606EF5E|nr:KDGP aldolase [Anoxybacillus rupiensis]MBB3908775.1 uncharacterized protein (TIGR03581 family) [Anoxybacillus rupiensis]